MQKAFTKQKKLIVVALAAAVFSAPALAETSNVTIYGLADVSYDWVKNGDGPTAATAGVRNNKISSNSSRIGFKGAEDLGGGLKAIWQIETAILMDGSATDTLATRNTFAGLSGDSWGSLTLGRNDTPYKSSTRGLDVFSDHIADNRTLMGRGKNGNDFDARNTDTVRYDSASMGGFKVALAYSTGSEGNTVSTADVKGNVLSMSGTYATGPFTAALAYQKNSFGSTSNVAALSALGAAGCVVGTVCDEKAWKIGGGYKVDQFAVNGVYEKTTDNLGSAVGGMGHKAYYLAGVFNATASDAIKAAYTKAKDLQDGSAANTGAKQWSLGYDHSMSKRTTVYAMYTRLDNDSARNYALSSAGTATGATSAAGVGAEPSAFSFGMKHTF